MAESLDIVRLNESLGAYCRKNQADLLSGILVQNKSFEHMTPMNGIKDEAPILDIDVSDIVKPYSSTWNPTVNGVKVKPRIMKVRTVKVELVLEPLAYEKTYLGHMLKPGTNPEKLPFEKYLMEKIAAAARAQLEMQGIFKGVYNAAGTTPADTMDGLNWIIAQEISAGKITPVVTGAITAANVVEKLEGMFAAIPEEYQAEPLKLFCSPKIKQWYNQAYRAAYGNVTHNTQFDKQYIDGTLCELVAMPGLAGSGQVHITPAWNCFYGTDLSGDMDTVRTQLDRWNILVMMAFKIGVQIGSTDYLWTNDIV